MTPLPASGLEGVAWSRAEWVEGTLSGWKTLVDPVADKVVEALGAQLPAQLGELAPGMPGMAAGPMGAMLRQLGGALFGTQIGQAIGALAGEVVSTGEVGVPVADPPRLALLPANVAAFGEGLELPADDVRLYLALREAAVQRLYTHVPVAAGTRDLPGRALRAGRRRGHRQAARRRVPAGPGRSRRRCRPRSARVCSSPSARPMQEAALAQLETVLALVEGWVDHVVSTAAAGRLPSAVGLAETIRRRRALGGPAEQTFGAIVGLDLRPRRMREAARLWGLLADKRGADGRDAVWAHPDLLPLPDDLDDPQRWVDGNSADLTLTDADLEALTREEPPATDRLPDEPRPDEPGPDEPGPDEPGPDDRTGGTPTP